MCKLMHTINTWNEGPLRRIVAPNGVNHLLQIPIPMNGTADRLLWPHIDYRQVTMRSVYHWFQEAHDGRTYDLQNHGSSTVWKTDTVPKVNNFMWKLLTISLAVNGNLRRRGMNVTTNCLVCKKEEDREHMIYKYG